MAVNTTLVWSNIVAALGAAIVSTLITAWYFRGGKPSVPSMGGPSVMAGVTSFAVETVTYVPHILLLFGVLADIFTMQGVYSIPSLVGLFSIPLNYVMKFFWAGLLGLWNSILELYNKKPVSSPFTAGPSVSEKPEATTSTKNPMTTEAKAPKPAPAPKKEDEGVFSMVNPMLTKTTRKKSAPVDAKVKRSLEEFGPKMDGGKIENYDGCDVQGFSFLSSPFAPQTLVVTATVFFYYIFDLIANRGWADATSSILVFAMLYLAETVIMGDCGIPTNKWVRSLLAFLEGMLFGGTSYSVVQAYYPSKLPTTVLPAFAKLTEKDLIKQADGTYVDKNGAPWNLLPDGSAMPNIGVPAGLSAALGEAATSTGAAAGQKSCSTK